MKRYLLFAGEVFYPGGGMNDLLTESDSLSEIQDAVKRFHDENSDSEGFTWFHVCDTVESKAVLKSENQPGWGPSEF